MLTGTSEEIRIGQLAIRFLVEGPASGGSVAVFEFDVPAGAKVPVAHSHDAYEETIYGLAGVLTSRRPAFEQESNRQLPDLDLFACARHCWLPPPLLTW